MAAIHGNLPAGGFICFFGSHIDRMTYPVFIGRHILLSTSRLLCMPARTART